MRSILNQVFDGADSVANEESQRWLSSGLSCWYDFGLSNSHNLSGNPSVRPFVHLPEHNQGVTVR
jgi:hypothetical protein